MKLTWCLFIYLFEGIYLKTSNAFKIVVTLKIAISGISYFQNSVSVFEIYCEIHKFKKCI